MSYTQIKNSSPTMAGTFVDDNQEIIADSPKIDAVRQILKNDYPRIMHNFNDMLADDFTGFFIRQLTDIELTKYEVLYKQLNGMRLFPVSSAYNVAAENVLFQVWDYRGEARTISNYGNVVDFPESDVLLKQLSVPIKSEGASFSYSIQDLRAAAMANQPLDQMKAEAARRTIEQSMNKRVWFGDVNTGRVGALTDPDVPYGTVPADGTGASTLFINKRKSVV